MVFRHAETRHREPGEDAYGIEGDQLVDLSPSGDEQDDRDRSQDDDAGREDEPVSPLHQLARQVRVLCCEARQIREPCEAGVGREHQDEHRGGLEQDVERRTEPARSEHVLRNL